MPANESNQNLVVKEISASRFDIDTVFSVVENEMIISGNASERSVISLERNGILTAATLTQNGRYEFEAQNLSQGENIFVIYGMQRPGLVTKIDSFTVFFQSQRRSYLSIPVERVNTTRRIFALTFDAGSEARGADSILSILHEKGVKVTIFVTGYFIEKYPGLLQKLIDDDHEIANHTYSHPHLTTFRFNQKHTTVEGMSRRKLQIQLLRTDSLYKALSGNELKKYWRAPFGEFNEQILNWAADIGYRHIGWSRNGDTRDWVADTTSALYLSAKEIYQRLINTANQGRLNGSILLMHLNSTRKRDHAYTILRKLIDELRIRGYTIVKISELLQYDLPT